MSTPLGSVTRTYEDGTTGWVAANGASIAQSATDPRWGEACCELTFPGTTDYEAITTDLSADVASAGSKQWTLSFYIRTSAQIGLTAQAQSKSGAVGAGGGFLQNHNINLGFVDTGGEWQRKAVTFVTHADATRVGNWRIYANDQVAVSIGLDGWQLDEGPDALEYDGDDYAPPAPEPVPNAGAMLMMGVGGGGGPTPFLRPLFSLTPRSTRLFPRTPIRWSCHVAMTQTTS